MKLLLTAIAAVMLVGCGESQKSTSTKEAKPVDPVAGATKPESPAERVIWPLHEAATIGNIKAVKQHLEAGTDVDMATDGGVTALHYAVIAGHKEIAELLIANGADVNLRSGLAVKTKTGSLGEQAAQSIINNKTPLDMALDDDIEIGKKLRKLLVDLLRKHGGKTGDELKAAGN